MADQSRFTHLLLAALTSVVVAAASPATAQDNNSSPAADANAPANPEQKPKRPLRADRVFVWDLQGTWISQAYLEKLKATRSPNAAVGSTPALAIKVEKKGNSYPILITDFKQAVLHYLIEVEPGSKSGAYRMVTAAEDGVVSSSDVTYIPFRGKRNAEGKFDALSIAEPHIAKRKYLPFVRLPDSVDAIVNELVIAGKYKDEQGRSYEFTKAGDAVLPERKFVYEISLDRLTTGCDLLHSHREREPQGEQRLGFAWKGSELQLFNVTAVKKDRYRCDAKPFAVLKPE